jgi:hypothetical protein
MVIGIRIPTDKAATRQLLVTTHGQTVCTGRSLTAPSLIRSTTFEAPLVNQPSFHNASSTMVNMRNDDRQGKTELDLELRLSYSLKKLSKHQQTSWSTCAAQE